MDPYEECGGLSEALWNQAGQVGGFLHVMSSVAGAEAPVVFGDLDCRALSEEDYSSAMIVVYHAGGLVSPVFLRCVIEREAATEAMPLWTALSAATEVPGAAGWISGRDFTDQRTLDRLTALGVARSDRDENAE